jgi:mono/diheme cytochrome c family protein
MQTVTSARPGVPVCAAHKPFAVAMKTTALGVGAAILLTARPVVASPDLALGEEVFSGNCATCHSGGKNVLLVRY